MYKEKLCIFVVELNLLSDKFKYWKTNCLKGGGNLERFDMIGIFQTAMKDCLVAPNIPEKPKVAPIIHERPKMPARTWSALRSHILTERKKKREEEGKQKEEERRKREREHRKKQEANNLEETKEQIAQLETKLSSLKEEKHQLFLTLKKVLNEDDVRRKKESSELSGLYPQPHHPNVLPLSGHIVQPPSSSRYIQPGQGSQHRQGMYMKPPVASPHLKRGRSPSPAAPASASVYHPPPPPVSSRPVYSSYHLPPLITTQASGHRDLLKEAVSQGLGLGHRERELLAGLGGSSRDIMAGMGVMDREMFAKGLAGMGTDLSSAAAQAAVSKETENYARYLSAFQHQLESGSKSGGLTVSALAEMDRARMAAAAAKVSFRNCGAGIAEF